ncbi:OmpA family protein [Ottowia beijingensis]|uniref:OmpA family protein n=2 Tax=Ottowia beijingensis TaxID=1207057 RepID=A0A853IP90_9BURK|nr:OmpA family protein [Ottowia beijingensis]NZA02433.1 OmpA family protein [Ottowia beijingensis]
MAQEVSANLMWDALRKDGFVTLPVLFDTGKASIRPESAGVVRQIADLLKQQPALKVSIEGHTDNQGNAAANKALSQQRAKAVVDAVTAQGVAPARMSAVGWGQDKPVADNRSHAGRARNRRVEMLKQ